MKKAEAPRHLLHVFSTFAVGGPQMRFVSLANALSGKYRHTILAMDGNHEAAAGLNRQLDCTFESMPVVKSGGISVANLWNARDVLRRLHPELLCTYNWGSIEWSLANWFFPFCPQIHVEDGFGPDELPERQHWRRTTMRRIILSRCARVVVPSRVLLDVAIEKWRLPTERVIYLPNGVDYGRFSCMPDTEFLATLRLTDEHLVVGTVAALRAEKNLGRLLRIFAALPPSLSARLVIVGDGPERGALEKIAVHLGIADRVVMTGAMVAPERILGRFDVFALSSDTEQMPNSILEAMAAGLPILATDVGDVKRIVARENVPFVISREDEATLGRGLMTLLQDRAARVQIGRSNRERLRSHFSRETMVSRYDELFERIADRGVLKSV